MYVKTKINAIKNYNRRIPNILGIKIQVRICFNLNC